MAEQLLSILIAVLIFPLLIWVPGAVLGAGADILGFRKRPVIIQASLALLLSIGMCPILVYLLTRVGGYRTTWAAYGIVWLLAAVMAVRHRRVVLDGARTLLTQHWRAIAIGFVWLLIVAFSEIDLVFSNGIFRSLNAGDAVAHVAYTDSLTRTGIPPLSPFVTPGYPVHLFYYYLWYLMCSLADQLGGSLVTARAAVQTGAFYTGIAICALAAVYIELCGAYLYPTLRRVRTGIVVALLAVTGLDLIPWAFSYFMKAEFDRGPGAVGSIEWWNEQVTAWLGAVLMSPHHVIGMVVCFVGLLLIMGSLRASGTERALLMILAAVTLASAAGISTYTIMALALGLLIWLLWALRQGLRQYVLQIGIIGVMAILLYAPFALELRASARTSRFPVALHIRAFSLTDYWLPSIVTRLKSMPDVLYALRLVCLPLNYFLELGFFFLATIFYWRWRRSSPQKLSIEEQLIACTAAGSVLLCTFFRSTMGWNDLGWRGFLIAQFVFLLWGAPVAQSLVDRMSEFNIMPGAWRRVVALCACIGIAGTAAEIVSLRTHSLGPSGADGLSARDAYIWVDHHTPRSGVVLFNPDMPIEYFDSFYGFRQAVAGGRNYVRPFFIEKGRETDYERVLDDAIAFFAKDRPVSEVLEFCQRYGATTIVVEAADPIWKDPNSWVWKMKPSFAAPDSRVFTTDDLRKQNTIEAGRTGS